MAVTSLWRVKGYIGKVVMYAINPEKTSEPVSYQTAAKGAGAEDTLSGIVSYVERDEATNLKSLVYGIKCHKDTAVQDMMAVKRKFEKTDGVIAYHGYQSFAEGEVTPDKAHEIGKALAKELWGNRYQVLITTHLDKDSHIHNHFVINTVSYLDGKKFFRSNKDYYQMREVSDRLCKEHGLSVIKNPKAKGKSYAEWRAEFEGRPTVRGTIREAIDIAVSGSGSRLEFLDAMDQMGFIIDQSGKYPKIKHIGGERFVRFSSLGPGYSPEEILERIRYNDYPEFPEVPQQESPQQIFEGQDRPVASMNYTAVYHCFVTALKITTERPNTNKKMCFLVREDQGKMRSYSDQLLMLTEHKIENREQLLAYRAEATAQIPEVIKLRQDMKNALKRAIRAGDEAMISKTKYNIDIYTRQLKKLRREIGACDGVLERMDSVREKLTRIESEKFRGKDRLKNEHISRSGRSSSENVT
jgi:hypothetical protein